MTKIQSGRWRDHQYIHIPWEKHGYSCPQIVTHFNDARIRNKLELGMVGPLNCLWHMVQIIILCSGVRMAAWKRLLKLLTHIVREKPQASPNLCSQHHSWHFQPWWRCWQDTQGRTLDPPLAGRSPEGMADIPAGSHWRRFPQDTSLGEENRGSHSEQSLI